MTVDQMIAWARERAQDSADDGEILLMIAAALAEYRALLYPARKSPGVKQESKTARLLAYLSEPRTTERIQEWWGGKSYAGALSALVACGAVRKYKDYNVDPKGHYSRLTASYYVATGEPYIPQAASESRRRYIKQWNLARRLSAKSDQ